MKNTVKCHGCSFFYITYKQSKPYGCKAYGFISKTLPAKVVFDSSGIKCAYKKDIKSYNNRK